MTICNDLREAVLQAAIQGKLVEQRSEEGTGEGLYRQIQAEKQKLIKKGKIKKEKPSPPINEDDTPFDIPENWKWVRLHDVCLHIFSGKSPRYSTTLTENICIGQANNQEWGVDMSKVKYVTDEFYESLDDTAKLLYGDVLLNTLGGGTVGRSGLFVGSSDAGIITDGHLFVLRTAHITTAKFLLAYLRLCRSTIEKGASGTTNQCFLKLTDVKKYLIPFPPLAEQKRIVAKIDELMAKIDDLEKTENELEMLKKDFPEDMKASILQSAMQGKLTERLDSDSNVDELLESIRMEKEQLIKAKKIKKEKPFRPISDSEVRLDIPENWRLARFGALVLNYDSKRKPVSAKDRVHGIYNYYGATGAIDKIESYLFDGEFLLIGEDGGNFFVSRDNSFSARGKSWTNNHVHVTKRVQINIKFLKYFLDSLNLPAMGLIKGIAVPKLNQGDLNSIVVPIPPVEEQQRIVDKLDELLPLCDTLQEGVE